MLRMLEVVGTSPAGFSEAVRAAVEEIVRVGHAAHFFQVVEQRGSIRDGRIKEFQVVLKVAVENDHEPAS
ncbi:MAG: dodecin family protein [Candidatus Aminicenantes bacterium]|nr:dodecin family protein [Candidatus Aminicenantes bacterium]